MGSDRLEEKRDLEVHDPMKARAQPLLAAILTATLLPWNLPVALAACPACCAAINGRAPACAAGWLSADSGCCRFRTPAEPSATMALDAPAAAAASSLLPLLLEPNLPLDAPAWRSHPPRPPSSPRYLLHAAFLL